MNFTKKILIFLFAALFCLSLVSPGFVNAEGNASFPQATTISMDVGNITITAGSHADEVVTTNSTITITISYGQTITFQSTDRKNFSVDGDFTSKTCTGSLSSVTFTPSAGDNQRTVVTTPQSATCVDTSGSSGGGGGGGGSSVFSTPTPTPSPTPTPAVTPMVTPTTTPAVSGGEKPTPASRGFVNLKALNLKEGDVISAAGSNDPDVYIANEWGYKRLFLNPAIFGFYGHLGGFSKVKTTNPPVRDTLITSGLYRNCETNDQKVYGVEINGEDSGVLHWVNTTGAQAVIDDPDFFKKVFCINTKELNWYPKGASYVSVNQVPDYTRNK